MPGKIAQRLLHRLADDDGGVLGGVMEIDMQVAIGTYLQIDHRMAREAFQHMVQEADAGLDVGLARPIQVEGDGDLGLAGLSFNGRGAHENPQVEGCIAAGG